MLLADRNADLVNNWHHGFATPGISYLEENNASAIGHPMDLKVSSMQIMRMGRVGIKTYQSYPNSLTIARYPNRVPMWHNEYWTVFVLFLF